MSKKLKGCRSLDEINSEYSLTCGQLGNFTFRRGVLAKEIERLNHRLEELDLEAGSAKQQMDAQAAEEAAKAAEEAAKAPPTEECKAAESATA